jgi:hypothetical protein
MHTSALRCVLETLHTTEKCNHATVESEELELNRIISELSMRDREIIAEILEFCKTPHTQIEIYERLQKCETKKSGA